MIAATSHPICKSCTLIGVFGFLTLLCSCASPPATPAPPAPITIERPIVEFVDIADPAAISHVPLQLVSAKNEWIDFVLRLRNLPATGTPLFLRINPLIRDSRNPPLSAAFSACQIVSMPVDTNRADYVRDTGQSTGAARLPRALLPLQMHDGTVDLRALRDPANPFNPSSHPGSAGEAVLLWIDLHVPADAAPADYRAAYALGRSPTSPPLSQETFSLHVFDFALPDQRHLAMLSQTNWTSLQRFDPDAFEAISPRLINRTDPRYAACISILDELMRQSQANRAQIDVSRIQPTVKWPPDLPPQVDWSDYDSLVLPWLNGQAFADKTPLPFWPLPVIDRLSSYDFSSQVAYWTNAARHFNAQDWLSRAALILPAPSEVPSTRESAERSAEARQLLDAHPLLRVLLPLNESQISDSDSQRITRLIAQAPGLVFPHSPSQQSDHWLRPGPAYTQSDVLVWAWLAFLQHASVVVWPDALPSANSPAEPSDPADMIWFYPGQWFGTSGFVPTVQLKWLRRAQQDYEYLRLASQQDLSPTALMVARLMTKQVELQPGQSADSQYALLTGSVDPLAWQQARSLLARSIELKTPDPQAGTSKDSLRNALDLEIIRWQRPRERPYILPRAIQWGWDKQSPAGNGEISAQFTLDIYNAGDSRPDQNLLQWETAGGGWQFNPAPQTIAALQTYWIQRFTMALRVDPDQINAESRKPLEFSFTDGYTRAQYHEQVVIPLAASLRREGGLHLNGKLDDWDRSDLIQDGPLTRMLDRPSVQKWHIESASTPSQIYSGWSDDDFYVAFHLGVGGSELSSRRNFINFQSGRAWSEDLCELVIQSINDDNTLGSILHVSCKPNGVCLVRTHTTNGTGFWHQTDTETVRYAAQSVQNAWTGELAIPWKLLGTAASRPRMLRFNFIQHRGETGESSSWAGPIDTDLDDALAGLIYIKPSAADSP